MGSSDTKYLIVGIIAIIAVVIMVAIIVLIVSNKNVQKEESRMVVYSPPGFVKNLNVNVLSVFPTSTLPVNPNVSIQKKQQEKQYRKFLTFTKVSMADEEVISVGIDEELYISTNASGSRIIVAENMRINDTYCKIMYDGESFSIEDVDSPDGIFVNGIPIKRRFYLANDDDIIIANNKWRINF